MLCHFINFLEDEQKMYKYIGTLYKSLYVKDTQFKNIRIVPFEIQQLIFRIYAKIECTIYQL